MQFWMRKCWSGALTIGAILLLSPCPQARADRSLGLSLEFVDSAPELGKPLRAAITFQNIGNEPLLLFLGETYGAEGINIVAKLGTCTFEVGHAHFDQPMEYRELSCLPLFPGDRFTRPLPPINELAGGDFLSLPCKGSYSIEATYRSPSSLLHSANPWLFRGSVSAPPVLLDLAEASEESRVIWRARLEACLKEPVCEDMAAIEYFRLVRDPKAAVLLRELFSRDYYENPRLVEALVAQGNMDDVEVIQRAATDPRLTSGLREYFLGMTTALQEEPCRCLPGTNR